MTRYTEFVELLGSPLHDPFLLALAHGLCISMRDVDASAPDPESVRRFAACNEMLLTVLAELSASQIVGVDHYAPDVFIAELRWRADRGGAVGLLQQAVSNALEFARAERERRGDAAGGDDAG